MTNGNGEVIRLLTEIKESLEREIGGLRVEIEATHKHIDTLAGVVDKHEHEHQRLRRTMRAALEAYLSDENGAA